MKTIWIATTLVFKEHTTRVPLQWANMKSNKKWKSLHLVTLRKTITQSVNFFNKEAKNIALLLSEAFDNVKSLDL